MRVKESAEHAVSTSALKLLLPENESLSEIGGLSSARIDRRIDFYVK